MRLPRVRFTVEWVDVPLQFSIRQLMVIVAIFAIVLGVAMIRHRRDRYLGLMRAHERSAQAADLMQGLLVEEAQRDEEKAKKAPGRLAYEFADQAILSHSMVSYWARKAAYHDELRRKYEEAASRPWRLISSDPPPPSNPLQP
jgi:hypothetical protein